MLRPRLLWLFLAMALTWASEVQSREGSASGAVTVQAPPVAVSQTKASEDGSGVRRTLRAWARLPNLLTQNQMDAIKGAVAAAGTLLLGWGWLLGRAGRPDALRRLRDALLLALGLFAGLCWWNLFHAHFGNYVHVWDTYHYYIGGKYFSELGYSRLYTCAVVADAEDGFLGRTETRIIRDLATNTLVRTHEILSDPTACTGHFSEERWTMFKDDIAWFRGRMSARRWAEAQRDHGYNGTPVWGILGTTLARTGPASTAQLLLLTLIDPLLLLAMWGVVGWTFGWRVMCVALLYWGTSYPARFWWNGGAYLRQDWLALSVVGICLLRRQRPMAAGFALTSAALLRVFPVLIVAGIILKALMAMGAARAVLFSRFHRRFAAGCIAAVVLLVPAASYVAGDWSAWSGFVENSRKHADTPLTNHMGLRTVMAYDHGTRARFSAPLGLEEDPFQVWKEGRRRVARERRYVFVVLVLGFLVLLARAVKNREDWVAAVLGIGLIPVAAELTCYYYSVLLAFGFLWEKRQGIGVALCALATVTVLIPAFSSWNDEIFTAISAVVVLFVVGATASFARTPPPEPDQAG